MKRPEKVRKLSLLGGGQKPLMVGSKPRAKTATPYRVTPFVKLSRMCDMKGSGYIT